MRVLFLNQAAWPDTVATAQHLDDAARALVRSGHEVHVLSSRALYGRPGATLASEEMREGVHHHRVGTSLFGKAGLLARAADFALFHAAALVRALRIPRPAVVVTLSTPPFLVVTALLLARLRGAKLVYWVMDLYPDVPIACGVLDGEGLPARALEALHRFALRRCELVIALGRCMRARILGKGVDEARIAVLRPWADPAELAASDEGVAAQRESWGTGSSPVVLYSGNLGLAHDVATMAGAAALLARTHPDLRFVIAGSGASRAEAATLMAPPGNAIFTGGAPRSSLGALLRAGDVHLVTLRDSASGALVPSKLFGIMGAARPLVYAGPADSEIGLLAAETGCGLSVRCGDAPGMASAIGRLVDDADERRRRGEAGLEALRTRHARSLACAELERLLSLVAGTARGPSR